MESPLTEMEKEKIKIFWDNAPCGTEKISFPEGSIEYFKAIERHRYHLEPFIFKHAQFEKWAGKKVLEIGCGIGIDLLQFAKAGADVIGIDLSAKSAYLTNRRLEVYQYHGNVLIGDAENLPFQDSVFDFIYSWGVLHHTPDPEKAIHEIYRVAKTSGEICLMIYHKHSLVALQCYLLFGLMAFKPFQSLEEIFANHLESPGTKAYTRAEARRMFSMFNNVKVTTILTAYDRRYKRNEYLPKWIGKFIPSQLGWFMVIRARKPKS